MNLIRRALAVRDVLAERKRLRGPAELQYAIADRIGMLDAATWDSLTEISGFFMSRGYLQALEGVLPANIQPRYALIYDAGHRPIAAVYMQLADIGVSQVRKRKEPAPDACSCAALETLAGKVSQRVLTCGNLLSYGQHGVAFVPDFPEDTIWHGVAEVLYRVRTADKLRGTTHFVLIKDVHGPFHKGASSLENLSYRYVETEPNMVLALEASWKSHDDYLASLSSKYRAGIRNNVLKPIEQAGCTVELLPEIESLQSRVHELYRAVQSNADIRAYELKPEYSPPCSRPLATASAAAGSGVETSCWDS
ncbi:MAG TPA: hypothetical protein VGE67_09305 [Haloferula sp.]